MPVRIFISDSFIPVIQASEVTFYGLHTIVMTRMWPYDLSLESLFPPLECVGRLSGLQLSPRNNFSAFIDWASCARGFQFSYFPSYSCRLNHPQSFLRPRPLSYFTIIYELSCFARSDWSTTFALLHR